MWAVALGGAIGSVLRYLVAPAMTHRYGHDFPYGTLLVNVTGSFLIGALAQYMLRHPADLGTLLRVFLIVGVLGGLYDLLELLVREHRAHRRWAPGVGLRLRRRKRGRGDRGRVRWDVPNKLLS